MNLGRLADVKDSKFILAMIVLLAAALRFYQLNTIPPGLTVDEATNGNDGLEAWRTGQFWVFYSENNGREGLFINLQAVVLGLVGRWEPWVLRVPSALLGSLTVWGMYFLAKRMVGSSGALWAAFLLGTSFWHLQVSRMGTRPVAAVFFLVWSLVALFKTFELRAAQDRRWPVMAVACGLVYGLGFHTYTAYRITPVVVATLLWEFGRREGAGPALRIAGVLFAVSALTVLPLALFAAQHPAEFFHRVRQLSEVPVSNPWRQLGGDCLRSLTMLVWSGDPSPRHNIPGKAVLFWPAAVMFGLGLLAARRHWPLWVWLAAGALPAVLAREVPHALRSVLMLPAVYLVVALGLTRCAEWLRQRAGRAGAVLVTGLAGVIAVESCYTYFVRWPRDPRVAGYYDQSLLAVAHRLESLPVGLPKYVILQPDGVVIRGLPSGAQPLMFLTDTLSNERRRQKNIFYLTPDQTNQIARGYVYVHFIEPANP